MSDGPMNDDQLLQSCLRGDVEEYQKIVNKYRGKAMAMAMNILRNREDAEDASQEAFIQVYQHLDKFDFKRSFPNWLYSILYKRCLDRLRKRRRFDAFFQKMKKDPSQPYLTHSLNPSSSILNKRRLLDSLNAKERISLFLWANEGYTSQEMASVMRCSPSTARVHLFKARKKIKALLESDDASM
jgi:RNA polymerase sigma-70 factor (ECF subfamily)